MDISLQIICSLRNISVTYIYIISVPTPVYFIRLTPSNLNWKKRSPSNFLPTIFCLDPGEILESRRLGLQRLWFVGFMTPLPCLSLVCRHTRTVSVFRCTSSLFLVDVVLRTACVGWNKKTLRVSSLFFRTLLMVTDHCRFEDYHKRFERNSILSRLKNNFYV